MKGVNEINMKIIRKHRYLLTIILFIVVFIGLFFIKNKLSNNKYNVVNKETDVLLEKINEDNEIKQSDECNVDIKGAIKNPGVYTVDCDNKVSDVINIAGGLKENADTSLINLAKKIVNEMVIIIYTKDEVKNSNIVDKVIKVVEKECVCPNIQNDGCINDKITDTIDNSSVDDDGLININIANKEKLLTIPGIGESKANAIINYRESKGNFNTIEDIKNVDGIGAKLYEEIKVYITT